MAVFFGLAVRNLTKLPAACLLLFAFCGCGKKEAAKPEADPATVACASHMLRIDRAKKNWAVKQGADTNATPTEDELNTLFRHGMPTCPGGGAYIIGAVGELPQCSIAAHNEYFKAHLNPEPEQ